MQTSKFGPSCCKLTPHGARVSEVVVGVVEEGGG